MWQWRDKCAYTVLTLAEILALHQQDPVFNPYSACQACHLNHYLSEPSALSGSCMSRVMEQLRGGVLAQERSRRMVAWCYRHQRTWRQGSHQEKGHGTQAHTYTPQRNTVFKKYLPVLPHFPRTLSRHWHRISARTRAISSVLEFSLLSDGTLLEAKCNGKPQLLQDHY